MNPDSLQQRMGIIGEPFILGFLLGMFIGVIGNLTSLNSLSSCWTILTTGIATSAVMVIFAKVVVIFSQVFIFITASSWKSSMKSEKGSNREWFLGINDAVGFGEPATFTSGLLLIPIMVAMALILPGNDVMPVVDLIALPFMIQGLVAISNGNMAKVIVNGT